MTEKPKRKQHGEREINEQARHAKKRFTDPESYGEIEDQYAIIEAATQEYVRSHQPVRGETGLEKLAIQRKIGAEREEADNSPADIISHGYTEMCAGIGIVINLAEKPAFPTKCDWVNDHVDETE